MKKTLFKSLSSSWNNVVTYFESEETKAQKNPLYKSFSLYIKQDFKLAFELLKKGYVPTPSQQSTFNQNLIHRASDDINFIFTYQQYTDYLPVESITNFCFSQDLSSKCSNKETIFDNFKHIFEKISKHDNFSQILYENMKKSIITNGLKLSQMKPKYEHTHTFDLDDNEQKIRNEYTSKIYNCLVLLPFMIKDLDQFVSLKSAIKNSISDIETNLQQHNVRVLYDGNKSIYSHSDNSKQFKVKTLNSWKDYLNKYDTTSLQEHLMNKLNPVTANTDQPNLTEEKINTAENNIFNQKLDSTFIKINNLKHNLNEDSATQVEKINQLYNQIKSENLNIHESYDLDSLYKDMPHVIEKFVSIDPTYRDKLKNIEGKSPEQIMVDSLNHIEERFTNYLENINQMKVSDLSVVGRTIKMKM